MVTRVATSRAEEPVVVAAPSFPVVPGRLPSGAPSVLPDAAFSPEVARSPSAHAAVFGASRSPLVGRGGRAEVSGLGKQREGDRPGVAPERRGRRPDIHRVVENQGRRSLLKG